MSNLAHTGALRNLLHFQKRGDGDDGYGNTIPESGPFATVFTAAAQLIPLRGSETVISARLTGVQPFACTIRQFAAALDVTASWQAIDARTGTVYQIKSPPSDPDNKHAWLDMLLETGVPS